MATAVYESKNPALAQCKTIANHHKKHVKTLIEAWFEAICVGDEREVEEIEKILEADRKVMMAAGHDVLGMINHA